MINTCCVNITDRDKKMSEKPRKHYKEDKSYYASERNKSINPFPNYSEFGDIGDFIDDEGRIYIAAYYGDGYTPPRNGVLSGGGGGDDDTRTLLTQTKFKPRKNDRQLLYWLFI